MTRSLGNAAKGPSLVQNMSSVTCNPISSPESVTDQALMTLGFVILLILALLGNIFVITVFSKRSNQLRSPVNCFIINMAVSDLLVPILVIPRRIQEIYLGWSPWLVGGALGDILCRVLNFADEVSVTVSSQSMVFIAAERFWSIVFPMRPPLISKQTTPKFICFTWIFSALFFSYYLFAHKLVRKDKTLVCQYGLPHIFHTWQDLWRADRMSLLAVFVVFPFVLLTAFYVVIIITLHRQEKKAIHLSSVAQRKRTEENQRVTIMLVTVVVLFFICWTPYYVYIFLQYYSLGSRWPCSSIQKWYLGSIYMNYAYTAINPLIYYIFNKSFRRGFHDLLFCRFYCSHCCQQIRVGPLSAKSANDNSPVKCRTWSQKTEMMELHVTSHSLA